MAHRKSTVEDSEYKQTISDYMQIFDVVHAKKSHSITQTHFSIENTYKNT